MLTLAARKIAIAQALFEVDDESLIELFERFLFEIEQETGSRWVPTEEELQGIKDALKQVKNGEAISEEDVRERYKKWLK